MQFISSHLQIISVLIKAESGAGSESGVGNVLIGWGWLVGVAAGMADILRFTGVGSAEGRLAFTCTDLMLPEDGVRGHAEGF